MQPFWISLPSTAHLRPALSRNDKSDAENTTHLLDVTPGKPRKHAQQLAHSPPIALAYMKTLNTGDYLNHFSFCCWFALHNCTQSKRSLALQ